MPITSSPYFNPTQISGCQLWLDASDTTTISLSGNNVTQWRDKSGSNNHATGVNNPVYANGTMNFLNASSRYFTLPNGALPSGASQYSYYFLCSFTDPALSLSVLISGGNGSGSDNNAFVFRGQSGGNVAVVWGNLGMGGSSAYTYNSNTIASTTYNSTGNGIIGIYINGKLISSSSPNDYTPVYARNQGNMNNTIGSATTSLYHSGTISEVIVFSNALTNQQQQQVEAYLAQKWGLVSQMPNTHPATRGIIYRSVKVNVTPLPFPAYLLPQSLIPLTVTGCQLWLDGKDPNGDGVVPSSATVTSWADKSGKRNNPTFSGTNPYYNATSNAVITANGNQYFTVPASTLATSTRSGSIFMVYGDQQTGGNAGYSGLYGTANPGERFYQSLSRPDGNGYQINGPFGPGGTVTTALGTTNTILYNMNYTFGSSSGTLRVNGTTCATSFQGTPSPSGPLTLSSTGWGDNANVRLYEVLTYTGDTPLTTTQIQLIEGYLAWKWNLISTLDTSHPYYSAAPVSRSASLPLVTKTTIYYPPYYEVSATLWNSYWKLYLAQMIATNSGLTITTSTLTGGATYSGNQGWTGGVLAPNGNIYFSPYFTTNILVLNPTTGVTSTLTGGATYSAAGWWGGVLAPNGNIYHCPYYAKNFLVLNPTTGDTSNLPLSAGITLGDGAFNGGVLAPNGNIYFAPTNAAFILALNPTTGVSFTITGGATYTVSNGWSGAVLGSDGNIYFAPVSAGNILALNPTTGLTWNITGGATYSGSWMGGVLAPNGNIYFAPLDSSNILVLNPTTGVTSTISSGSGSGGQKWRGGTVGPDGNIYFSPYAASSILVLNLTTGVASSLTGSVSFVNAGWSGNVLGPDGNIYCAPHSATAILKINFSGLSLKPTTNYCLSAYINKF